MIVESAKLIFIHVPKTGGTTFEHYLAEKYGVPLPYNDGPVNNHSPQHCSYEEIKQILRAQGKNINNYRIIAFVRDPFHRLISDLFFYGVVDADTPRHEIHGRVMRMFREPSSVNGVYEDWDRHLAPQHEFILDRSGRVPPNTVVINTQDIDRVLPKLGFDGFRQHARINTNRAVINYDDFLPEETKAFVRRHYKRDFELFFDAKKPLRGVATSKVRTRRVPHTVCARWG